MLRNFVVGIVEAMVIVVNIATVRLLEYDCTKNNMKVAIMVVTHTLVLNLTLFRYVPCRGIYHYQGGRFSLLISSQKPKCPGGKSLLGCC